MTVALQKKEAERWSYAEIADYATRLARGLQENGVGRGHQIALLAENRAEWIIACLGVIRSGATIVPLDVQLADRTLRHTLDDSEARLIFTTGIHADRLAGLGARNPLRQVLLDGSEDDDRHWTRLLASNASHLPLPEGELTATLFYTSGTTGPPKGVPLSHGNLMFEVETLLGQNLVREGDRILLPLPMHHVYPFVIGMFGALATGAPLVLPHSLTGPEIARALREEQATILVGVPRLYRAMYAGIEARAASAGWFAARMFAAVSGLSIALRRRFGMRAGKTLLARMHRQFGPSLRMLASGGSALDPELAWKLEGLGWEIAIGYGLTETSPLLTLNPPGKARIGSAGRVIPGVELRIDTSVEGEILARGPNVFAGYRNLPEATAEAFTSDGWFRTGDLGHFDKDGYLYISGRVSTVIVTESGKNVQPDEVEDAYLESPAIGEIGVLGENGKLAALIVPNRKEIGERPAEEAIHKAVEGQSRKLPSYQRISHYELTRSPLPRTRLGKIRRHELEACYRQAKGGERESKTVPGPMPVEEMTGEDRLLLQESGLREIWNWLAARYPHKPLTPDTNPHLDLGIDSMEWLNLTLEIAQRTGLELTEEAIARVDTVRDLLREATQASEGTGVSIEALLRDPGKALTEEQREWLQPLGPVRSALAPAIFALPWLVLRSYFRLRVEGLENLPRGRNYVITPNHVSYLDAFAVAIALGLGRLRHTYWGGWTGVAFRNPLARFFSRVAKVVPVELGRSALSSLAFGAAVLKRGDSLVWFPEGERSVSGRLQPFKPGIGMLVDHFQVPIIPAYLHGAYEALPSGRAFPRPSKITVAFGPPLNAGDLERQGEGKEARDRIAYALRQEVARLGQSTAAGGIS